jgi:hypothetical protein
MRPKHAHLSPLPLALGAGGSKLTKCGLELPANLSKKGWINGRRDAQRAGLIARFRARGDGGDWWAYGEHRYGDRTAIISAWEAGSGTRNLHELRLGLQGFPGNLSPARVSELLAPPRGRPQSGRPLKTRPRPWSARSSLSHRPSPIIGNSSSLSPTTRAPSFLVQDSLRMTQRPRYDDRRYRPPSAPLDHLRDERRKLSAPKGSRPQEPGTR